jgi:hypothetical protein
MIGWLPGFGRICSFIFKMKQVLAQIKASNKKNKHFEPKLHR